MCWVMPPFSCGGHVDAEDPVQERRLAVVDVAQEGDHRRPRLEVRRVVGLLQRREHLLFQATGPGGNRPRRPAPRPAARPSPAVERGGDRAHRAQLQQLGQHLLHGHADGLGETADRARQIHDHLVLAGRGGAGVARAAEPAGFTGRRRLLFVAVAALGRRRPLPLQLPLLAAAQRGFIGWRGGRPRTALAGAILILLFRQQVHDFGRVGDHGRLARRLLAAGLPLLLLLADVLRQRLAAGLRGADRVRRSLMSGFCGVGSTGF